MRFFLFSLLLISLGDGVEAAIFSGTEFNAGYRTDYIFRGQKVGSNIMETQFSSGLALTDYCDFNFSGYLYQAPDINEFSNLGAYGEFCFYLPADITLSPFAAANEYRHSEFESGMEWGVTLRQEFTKAWFWDATALYDTGQLGGYGAVRLHYFPQLAKNVGLHLFGGVGAGYDYFETKGINELFFRVSVPVVIDDNWTIEPFMGVSGQQGQKEERVWSYYGVWVSFLF